MRILVATDSFPPDCGGSGWSTWELAHGLRARGHDVRVVQPRTGQQRRGRREYDGFEVDEFPAPAPAVPFLRNHARNERLYPRLAAHLANVITSERIDIVHGQHVLTTPPAIEAARQMGRPVVATVRDYWPVCYWSTLIHDPAADTLCPECTVTGMQRCLRPRVGVAWPLSLPVIPYMRRNLALKRGALARADAIIAVSRQIAEDLRARAPELAAARIEQIPNPFDIEALRAGAARTARPAAGPYALYVGKLEENKGADLLPGVAARAGLALPLVVVGDGALRSAIDAEARARGVDLRIKGWLPRDETLGWLAGASLLVFPSRGPESLSRVLIEAGALGVPAAAMETGGTADIIEHGVTGLLSPDPQALARDVARLAGDPALASALGAAARTHVEARFDASRVVARIEALYEELVRGARGGPRDG